MAAPKRCAVQDESIVHRREVCFDFRAEDARRSPKRGQHLCLVQASCTPFLHRASLPVALFYTWSTALEPPFRRLVLFLLAVQSGPSAVWQRCESCKDRVPCLCPLITGVLPDVHACKEECGEATHAPVPLGQPCHQSADSIWAASRCLASGHMQQSVFPEPNLCLGSRNSSRVSAFQAMGIVTSEAGTASHSFLPSRHAGI